MDQSVASSRSGEGRQPLLAAATAAVVTLLIATARVSDHAYWLDEASSANVVNRSWFGLVRVLGRQAAGMFSFHVGLWIWAQPFGRGDVALSPNETFRSSGSGWRPSGSCRSAPVVRARHPSAAA